MDQDSGEDHQTRAHLARLYAGLSQAQRDAIGDLLRAAQATGTQSAPDTSPPSQRLDGVVSAEDLAGWHLRLGRMYPADLAHALRTPVAIIALGLATPADVEFLKRGLNQ